MALHIIRPQRNDALPSFSAFMQILNFLKIYDYIDYYMKDEKFIPTHFNSLSLFIQNLLSNVISK